VQSQQGDLGSAAPAVRPSSSLAAVSIRRQTRGWFGGSRTGAARGRGNQRSRRTSPPRHAPELGPIRDRRCL